MRNKTITILLIIILSLIALILGVFLVKMLTGSFNLNNFQFGHLISDELAYDETFTDSFEEIIIDSQASDIHITESTDNIFRVTIYGDREYTHVDTTNNSLKITTDTKKCIGFCFNTTISKIEVTIPANYSKLLDIVNNYGDIEIGHLPNAVIKINEKAGDVEVNTANNLTINNNFGDIIIDNANVAKIKASAGDVKIGTTNEIELTNNYGDITIENVNRYLDINDSAGDIKINHVNLIKDSQIKNSYGDITIGSTNEIYIDAKTSLGDYEINHNYPKSDIKLTINNSCGDITINN